MLLTLATPHTPVVLFDKQTHDFYTRYFVFCDLFLFCLLLQIGAGSKLETFIGVYFRHQALLILENVDICSLFLSDPSPIIVYPCQWLTDWLTHCCLVNLIDVTLACEDANSKVVNVVTVADEDRVGNNLLQISKLRFGQKANLLFRLWAQGLVKILKLKFRQDLKLELGPVFLLVFCRGY